MIFPFSLHSPENFLDFVPSFLLSLPEDSPWIDHDEFVQYLVAKLQEYFLPSPRRFVPMILSVLENGTNAGKLMLINVLLKAVATWHFLAEQSELQALLTEMALSSDIIYSKAAAELSRKLEEILDSKTDLEFLEETRKTPPKPILAKEDAEFTPDSLSSLWEESGDLPSEERGEEEKEEHFELRSRSAPARVEASSPPPSKQVIPPPQPPSIPASVRSSGIEEKQKKSRKAPSSPSLAAIPEAPPTTAEPAPMDDSVISISSSAVGDDLAAGMPAPDELSRDKPRESDAETFVDEETIEQIPSPRTIHTHLHYFSRMNPRKTYPFTVTLSAREREIMRDKSHIFSGEQETEVRDKFELVEPTRQLHVEPLLSGCLIQPTYQRVNIESQNFPIELVFFVTPLVDPGLRSTPLNGKIYIRNERGTLLQEMTLPRLSVSSHRFGQLIASLGTLAGGTLPALDFLFGVNLQATLAAQLAYVLPTLADSISMDIVVTALEVLVFIGALALGGIWWWKKGRAKLAPTQKAALNLSS
ncbi:MAG: hypothetical protein ACFFE8_02485 [Candidatus Heimdallarchaeota archaeon]